MKTLLLISAIILILILGCNNPTEPDEIQSCELIGQYTFTDVPASYITPLFYEGHDYKVVITGLITYQYTWSHGGPGYTYDGKVLQLTDAYYCYYEIKTYTYWNTGIIDTIHYNDDPYCYPILSTDFNIIPDYNINHEYTLILIGDNKTHTIISPGSESLWWSWGTFEVKIYEYVN